MLIDSSIFRAYDIRGIAGKTLTEEAVYAIGQGLGSLALDQGERFMSVARDGRLSGVSLARALSSGIRSTGCDVVDLGAVPTPLLYYATRVLDSHSGVMLTGSHNPSDYNGLKMVLNSQTLGEDAIQALYKKIGADDFRVHESNEGEHSELDIMERYINHLWRDIKLARRLKIVVDCGSGIAGVIAPALYRRLGCEVIELFCEVDGHFPHHHPDPSQPNNLQDIMFAVKAHGADVGLAFDGDGDRLGVVTNKGNIIWPDRFMMLFAEDILKRNKGATIIYDVKCSTQVRKVIEANGGHAIMSKTGHSFMKAKLLETGALLAGEMSGHLFFKDQWYGFDDALFAGARLLKILALSDKTSEGVFEGVPNSMSTPELKIAVSEEEKFLLMEKIIERAVFPDGECITIDGLRVEFNDGWGLIRPSNTTPCLVLRFEADSEEILKKIQDKFRELLLSVKSDWEQLPF